MWGQEQDPEEETCHAKQRRGEREKASPQHKVSDQLPSAPLNHTDEVERQGEK